MHLYIGVGLRQLEADLWEAEAPDLPAACASAKTAGEALARIRLVLEGLIAERLGREQPLPAVRSLAELEASGEPGVGYYEVHINLRHLNALARHQQGHWGN